MLSSYSVNNLAHAAEFLLNLAKTLDREQATLQKLKDEVSEQQHEAHKEGQLVKKMTNYLSVAGWNYDQSHLLALILAS